MPEQKNPLKPDQSFSIDDIKRLSFIWVIPLIAALAAAWLFWHSLSNWGPTITITFENADGLEPGKTKIKHRDVELGTIKSITSSPDLSHVIITATMSKVAAPHLTTGTRFWIVRPRLSLGGISGLGTLVSGLYVEMDPGEGDSAREFTGLEEPPVILTSEAGRSYTLHTTQLGSIDQGAPIYFHGAKVGEVLGYDLSDATGGIAIHVFIRAPHDQLVHEGTKFWNASGVSLSIGSQGLKVETPSLAALFVGGINFDIPEGADPGKVAPSNAEFTLYDDEAQASDAIYKQKIRFLMYLDGNVSGLNVGSLVRLNGVKVGEVTDVHIAYNAALDKISTPVTIEIQPARIQSSPKHDSGKPTRSEPEFSTSERSYAAFRHMVLGGLRAQLRSVNLLTGQKAIDLNFIPNTPPADMIEGGAYPEIPTVETEDLDSVLHTAQGLLTSLQGTAQSLNRLVSSPEAMRSLQNLDSSLANLNSITHDASINIGPLLASMRRAAASADEALGNQDAGSGDLAGTLRELKEAAKSMRALADYLERHPESLLRGKSEGDAP